jgi:hypothetical protein
MIRDSISGRPATIKVGRGPHAGLFTVPKALLCNSSAYFKAALNGTFIEGQTQTIDLDDEDPSVFRTYLAWLYQEQLNSRDIEEELDDPQDFGLHIAELIVFADKRGIDELKNDAISMLLDYLRKNGLAALKVINYIYDMPESDEINELCRMLAHEEVWFGHRLDGDIQHWHPDFMAEIIKIYRNPESMAEIIKIYRNPPVIPGRPLTKQLAEPSLLCHLIHKHTLPRELSCSSLVKNEYFTAPPAAQGPPKKKRRTMPSTQTVEILDD